MANGLPQAEFWLPPEFLTEDDIITDFKPKAGLTGETDSVLHFPEWGGCFKRNNSGLDSPLESIGSEESSDEEDYLAELSRKMSNSSFFDDLWKSDTQKSWGMSVSPQSTLSGFEQGSSRGSPNCPSPPTAADQVDVGWELLYAAAGEVARMRMTKEANNACYQNRGLFNPGYRSENSLNFGLRSNQSVSYQQLQIAKFQQLRREQLIRQQHALQIAQAKARVNDRQPANLSTVNWPTLHQSFQPQQQPATPGSGMRAVFLGNTAPKRESAGTGVFIPRRAGAEPPRKSSGCSTVLLPDRVVQALNLNLEAHSRLNNSLTSDLDGAIILRNNAIMAQQQKMNLRAQVAHSDLRLPQEWTY